MHGDASEPGDDRRAPYYPYHQLAMFVEYGLLPHLKLTEAEYEEAMMKLWRPDAEKETGT